MVVLDVLYGLLIAPIELLFEFIFTVVYHISDDAGSSIVFLSLVMNFLVLPLYRRADLIQGEEREKEAKLKGWTDHIKKTFHGDERFMMLQTYYRQNGYKQTDALKGSLSLLLEIPFFIAAYHFLSNLHLLNFAGFLFIHDLAKPDQMLLLAGHKVNLLPILMTFINFLSVAIYMKGFPLKNKIQTYGMAVIFLIFLYSSPSGLVFYWTLNNIFSLFKNLLYKVREREKKKKKLQQSSEKEKPQGKVFEIPDKPLFLYNTILLAVLSGLYIPSSVVRSSPAEFMSITELRSPLWIILYAVLYAVGTFVIWFGIFYRIAEDRGKKWFEGTIWLFSCMALVDYMFFGTDYGNLSSLLVYNVLPGINRYTILRNLGILLVIWVTAYIIYRKKPSFIRFITGCAAFVLAGMSLFNIIKIQKDVSVWMPGDYKLEKENNIHFNLSQTGKNVIVLMMDRAVGGFIPYVMKEKPELQKKFAGFTWYPNTISYGTSTLTGSPALYGGYEYTPKNLNARSDISQKEKQNEALKVMPVLFDENDYEVTVCDPSYAGFQWIPDLTIYDDYPDINKYITLGAFNTNVYYDNNRLQKRNIFCFSLFRMAPQFMQLCLYDEGKYNRADEEMGIQIKENSLKGKGINTDFLEPYAVLSKLSSMTQITSDKLNTFLMMSNDTTHEPTLLQEPEYTPSKTVDNTPFETEDCERKALSGNKKLILTDKYDMAHYHVNMASLLKLADWFDFMRKNDVYDNTKIIIVADHGANTQVLNPAKERLPSEDPVDQINVARFNPVLMVKDFGSKEFQIDEAFMTNADTPTLAFKDLIPSPVNPFTGNIIDNKVKAVEQQVSASDYWDINENNGKTLLPADWFSVKPGDIYDLKNWKRIAVDAVSP